MLDNVNVVNTVQPKETKTRRGGRRHLDGSKAGQGEYLTVVAITLRPSEVDGLEELGNGNRSAAVRRLLAMYQQGQLATA